MHGIRSIWSHYRGPDYYTNYYMKLLVGTVAVRAASPLFPQDATPEETRGKGEILESLSAQRLAAWDF